jgi:hypothetical protein
MSYPDAPLSLPIPPALRWRAEQVAQRQPDPEQAHQLLGHLLALQLVANYLALMGIEVDVSQSPCWQKAQGNPPIALLTLAGGDQFQCCWVTPHSNRVRIGKPSQAPDVDPGGGQGSSSIHPRKWPLGYVVVCCDLQGHTAQLLGFAEALADWDESQPPEQTIAITQLQPLDQLLVAMHRPQWTSLDDWFQAKFAQPWQAIAPGVNLGARPLSQGASAFRGVAGLRAATTNQRDRSPSGPPLQNNTLQNNTLQKRETGAIDQGLQQFFSQQPQPLPQDPRASLSQLIHHILEDEELRWRAADLLWAMDAQAREPHQPPRIASPHGSSGIRRCLDLSDRFDVQSVTLMVGLLPRPDGNRSLLLRLYPTDGSASLLEGIELAGYDAQGKVFLSTQARPSDDYIQLKFAAQPGERFSLKVLWGGVGITEAFVA